MSGGDGQNPGPAELDPRADSGLPTVYQIRIAGQLDARWAAWFEGLTITLDGSDALITGPVVDQAALHGLLKRVRDLGMPLISVGPVSSGGPPLIDVCQNREIAAGPALGRSAARSGEKQ